jgi:nicotinamidase-related amidase
MTERKIIVYNADEVLGHGVDPLNGFFYGYYPGKPDVKCLLGDERMQRIVPNMIGLNVYLAAKSVDCIVTADEHEPDDDEIKIAGLPLHCMKKTWEAELIDQLKIFNLRIITKKTTNSFINTELMQYLRNRKPKVVIPYGVCSNICCLQAIITYSAMADELGIERIIVAKDCMTTFGDDFELADKYAFDALSYVPKVQLIESYRDLEKVLLIPEPVKLK